MREAVIVSTARTGLAKSFRGGFNDTEAPAMGGHVVRAAVARAGIDPAEVDDCIFGAAAQQGTQAYNIGRLCGIAGGLPDTVPEAVIHAGVANETWRQAEALARAYLARIMAHSGFSERFRPCIAALERHIDSASARIERLA